MAAVARVEIEMKLMRMLIRLLKMTCEGAASLVSGSLDRRPTGLERLAMRLHLLVCPGCRRFERQMWFLRSVMARWELRTKDEDAPPGLQLPPDVRERIREALADASRPSSRFLPGATSDQGGQID
jgi:hypothetical protein